MSDQILIPQFRTFDHLFIFYSEKHHSKVFLICRELNAQALRKLISEIKCEE
jgi:hypothetical protein